MPSIERQMTEESLGSIPTASVLVIKKSPDGKTRFLLAKRLKGVEKGRLSVPGGRENPDENPAQCGLRELFEETGIKASIENLFQPLNFENLIYEGRQTFIKSEVSFINRGFILIWQEKMGSPENKEPDKHGEWEWYELPVLKWLELRGKLSLNAGLLLEAYEEYKRHCALVKAGIIAHSFEPRRKDASVRRLINGDDNSHQNHFEKSD